MSAESLIGIINITSESHQNKLTEKVNYNKNRKPKTRIRLSYLYSRIENLIQRLIKDNYLFVFFYRLSIIALYFSIVSSNNLYSQQIRFKHLTVENGLSNNTVRTVIQDKNGFIWFGTNDGLNRYDGYNFDVFRYNSSDSNTISDNSIHSLLEDKNGEIWIGTKSGVLNKYSPKTEKFSKINFQSKLKVYNGIESIYEDKLGNLWIGTHLNGLYQLNSKYDKINHWKTNANEPNSLSNNYVLSILEDNFGNIIIATYNGLNILNPSKPENGFKVFYHEPNNPNSINDNLIWSLSESTIDSNIIWIGTSKGVTEYNSLNSTFRRIKIEESANLQFGVSCSYIIDEINEGEKYLWANSYGGLLRVNLTAGITKRFIHDQNNPQSLNTNRINKILKDRTGVIWAATENGISYFTPKSTSFNSREIDYIIDSQLEAKNVTALSRVGEDTVWIGTSSGLFLLSNWNSNPQVERIPKLDGLNIWSLLSINSNELWIGTYGNGLKKFNLNENKLTNWDVSKTKVGGQSVYFNKALLQDSKKNIWIGYWGAGLVKLNPTTERYKVWLKNPSNLKSLSYNSVWTIKEDQLGRIWIGTFGGGLNLYEEKNGGIFHNWFHTDSLKLKLSSNNIISIHEAENIEKKNKSETILWIGTDNGLNKCNIKNISGIYDVDLNIKHYSVKEGLSDNTINSISEDDNGNLWLGTNSGISFFDVTKDIFINYSKEDGINGNMMNPESAIKLDSGIFMIGGTDGLNTFDAEKIKSSEYIPDPVITDFKIFNKTVKNKKILKESILSIDTIELSYDQDVFSFEFAALDYNSPMTIRYAYKMEGFDKDWIYSGRRRFVTYTNLDPGEYVFKVKSTNADGIWNDKNKSITIIIDPPYWKTWWAYIAYLLSFSIGFYLISKYIRKERLKKEEIRINTIIEKEKLAQAELRAEAAEYKAKVIEKEKEIEKEQIRNRISADLHDEIGSNLSSIILLSSLIKKKQNFDSEIKKYISEINGAAKLSAEGIRDIVWFINPASDQVSNLAAKMVQTANTMLGNIEYELIKSNFDASEKLQPNVKRNILLIFKEILNNLVKHSQADFVSIEIQQRENIFKFSVSDNGIGINLKEDYDGNGLKNLRFRANQINAEFKISSDEHKGTKITLVYTMA